MRPAPLCDRRGVHLFTSGRCLLAASPAPHAPGTAHTVVAAGKTDAVGHAVTVRIEAAAAAAAGGAGSWAAAPSPLLAVTGSNETAATVELDASAVAAAPDGATVAVAILDTNEVRLYKAAADADTPLQFEGTITRLAHATRALAYDPRGRYL